MKDFYAYFGGYGDQYWTNLQTPNFRGTGNCITVCRVNGETGAMREVRCLDGISSPGTLVVSPDQKYLYAANELNSFQGIGFGGGISAFSIDSNTGDVRLINQSLAFGSCTAYVTLDRTGKFLLVANHGSYYYVSRYAKNADGSLYPTPVYDEGCVCLFAIREDGGIGELLDRIVLEGTGADPLMHGSSHPHSVLVSDNDDVIIPNKGGDNIYLCRLDREAKKLRLLSVYETGTGSSPRHAFFCKGTPYVLVLNEFDGHLCSYELDRAAGTLKRISCIDSCPPENGAQKSDLIDFAHPWGCDVQVHPNGKFVYCDNSANTVSLFLLNRETGELTLTKRFPVDAEGMIRGMQIDRDGRFLVVTCVNADKAIVYAIDPTDGHLTQTSMVSLRTPTALRFVYPEGEIE